MTTSSCRYYLRSTTANKRSSSTTSTATVSPTSPLESVSPIPSNMDAATNTMVNSNSHSVKSRNPRKRRFCDMEKDDTSSASPVPSQPKQPHEIHLNVKFTLKHEEVVRREASLSASSPVLHKKRAARNKERAQQRRIEEFEVPIPNRLSARNPFLCCYEFFGGYRMGICMTLGNRTDVKAAIKILSQDLVSTRAKASIETAKNTFLVYIKTRKLQMIACSIVHIDHTLKRVNIDMFAVDDGWRGNGFASLMVYLIQWRMYKYDRYDLFVCAANSAVPFWSNAKYKFCMADRGLLEQHEIDDEKNGHTKHMIWCGSPLSARYELLQRFMQTE